MVKRKVNKKRYGRKLKQKNGNRRHAWKNVARAVGAHVGNFAINRAKHGIKNLADNYRRKRTEQFRSSKATPIISTGEVSYVKKRLGKPMRHNIRNAWKELESTHNDVYYRLQGLTAYSNAFGFYTMERGLVGTAPQPASSQTLPLYLVELTPVPINGSSTVYNTMYRMLASYNGSTPNSTSYGWAYPADINPDGTGGLNNWEVEMSGKQVTTTNHPVGPRDILSYADIKLICVGAANTPTTFEISIIQLAHDWLHPMADLTQQNTTTTQLDYKEQRDRVWEAEVWPYITSPIMPRPPKMNQRYIKTLHRVKFVLQAKTSIETSNEAHHKIVNIFKWFNRRQNYDWQRKQQNPVVGALGVPTLGYPLDNGGAGQELSNTVVPRARIYLMIKATNQSTGAFSTATSPSFDLVIRKKHIMAG